MIKVTVLDPDFSFSSIVDQVHETHGVVKLDGPSIFYADDRDIECFSLVEILFGVGYPFKLENTDSIGNVLTRQQFAEARLALAGLNTDGSFN